MSRRTFFRYFDSKASVLWGEFDSEITVIREALAQVPDSVPMMDAIRQAVVAANHYRAEDVPELRARMNLIASAPSLQSSAAVRYDAWERVVSQFVATRTGHPPWSLYPLTVGRSTLAACRAAYERWSARASRPDRLPRRGTVGAVGRLRHDGDGVPRAAPGRRARNELRDGDRVLVVLLSWQQALKALTLSHCAFWADSPASAPATLAPPSAAPSPPQTTPPAPLSPFDPGEQQLVSVLDPADLTNCVGRPALEGGGVLAAITQTVSPGPTFVPWSSSSRTSRPPTHRSTPAQPASLTIRTAWRAPSWADGRTTACRQAHWAAPTSGGDFRMVWLIDNSLIGVVADGTNGTVLNDWWSNWCYVTGGR